MPVTNLNKSRDQISQRSGLDDLTNTKNFYQIAHIKLAKTSQSNPTTLQEGVGATGKNKLVNQKVKRGDDGEFHNMEQVDQMILEEEGGQIDDIDYGIGFQKKKLDTYHKVGIKSIPNSENDGKKRESGLTIPLSKTSRNDSRSKSRSLMSKGQPGSGYTDNSKNFVSSQLKVTSSDLMARKPSNQKFSPKDS